MTTYITEQERKFLVSNFKKMKEELDCTNASFDPNNDESKLPLSVRLLAPGKRTIAKFTSKTEKTSRESVQKIVTVYNLLFVPGTDIDSFLSVDVFKRDQPKRINIAGMSSLIGDYYTFYLSDNFVSEIHAGYLKIFEEDAQLFAYLIMGLYTPNHLYDIESGIFDKIKDSRDRAKILKTFNAYRGKLLDLPENRNFSISSGKVKVLDRSAIIEFANMNNPNHITVVSIATSQKLHVDQFLGGMSVFLSPATEDLHTRVCKMIITRTSDVSDDFLELLMTDTVDNNEWLELLKADVNQFGRIEILDEDINKLIVNKLRKRYRRK